MTEPSPPEGRSPEQVGRWWLALRVASVTLVAVASVALSMWTFSATQPSTAPRDRELPRWLVGAWDTISDSVGRALDGPPGTGS